MSPKTGRPKSEKPKEVRFSIRLDDETNTKLLEYCKEKNISKGEAIREGIALILAKQ